MRLKPDPVQRAAQRLRHCHGDLVALRLPEWVDTGPTSDATAAALATAAQTLATLAEHTEEYAEGLRAHVHGMVQSDDAWQAALESRAAPTGAPETTPAATPAPAQGGGGSR